jgi:hypothetical protein
MSCCNDFTNGLGKVINYNLWPVGQTHDLLDEVIDGDRSKWAYLWIMPLNLGASLIGIALAPIAILLDLLCAAIFKIYNCFKCDHGNHTATRFVQLAAMQVDEVFHIVGRIFSPGCQTQYPITSCVANWQGETA